MKNIQKNSMRLMIKRMKNRNRLRKMNLKKQHIIIIKRMKNTDRIRKMMNVHIIINIKRMKNRNRLRKTNLKKQHIIIRKRMKNPNRIRKMMNHLKKLIIILIKLNPVMVRTRKTLKVVKIKWRLQLIKVNY